MITLTLKIYHEQGDIDKSPRSSNTSHKVSVVLVKN